MNKEEQEIIESTKEFAKAHNIHYDQMTENMILNAMREQLLLHNVSQQRELLAFVKEVAEWDKEYSSTNLKLKAKEILKANCG